jgi:hypothetical protein
MANEEKKKFKDTVVGKLFQPKKKEEAPAAKKSFGDAFKEARKAQGADGEFSWNGKKYNTKYKEEVGLKTSPVPKPRPTKSAEPGPVAKKGQTESAAPSALATTTTSLTGRGKAPGSSGLRPVVTNQRGPSSRPVLKTSKLPTDAKIDAKDKSGRSQKGRPIRKLPPKVAKLDKVPKVEVPETKEAPKDKSGRSQKGRPVVRTSVPKVVNIQPKDKSGRGPSSRPVLKTSVPKVVNVKLKDKSGRSQKGRPVLKTDVPKVTKVTKVDKSGRGPKTRPVVKTTVPKVTTPKVPKVTTRTSGPKTRPVLKLTPEMRVQPQQLTDTSDIKDKLKGGAFSSALKLVAKRVPFLGALVPDKMGDGTIKSGVIEKAKEMDRLKKKRRPTPDGQKTPGQPEPQPEKQSGFRGPRGETKLEMRKKGYFWNQSDKEWKKTQESEARTGMKYGGRVQSKAYGGRIKTTNKSRGGGAATKGTSFKGSF